MYNRPTTESGGYWHKALAMITFIRRSLLTQLIGVYLVLVLIVIGSGVEIDILGQREIHDQMRNADVALAQEVAFDTYTTISQTETSLVEIEWAVAGNANNPTAMANMFAAFEAARPDIDRMYWLDANGIQRVSVPANPQTMGAGYATTSLFQLVQLSDAPVVQGGTVDATTAHDVVTVAKAVYDSHGRFLGMLATTLLLDDLSQPLGMVTAAQTLQGQHITISLLDDRGLLIAAPDPAHAPLLRKEDDRLPGAAEGLAGTSATYEAAGPGGHGRWLYSAVPVPGVAWVVIVQQPMSDLAAMTSNFSAWLLIATGLFALGGLIFWLMLVKRVVQPLHRLAAPTASLGEAPVRFQAFIGRGDEIGSLARALDRLSHDVKVRLAELHTLLKTSNAVVNSLDPRAVGETIIREVRRLVDVQAAAVLVPDDQGILRVLVSVGRADNYESRVHVSPEQIAVPSARALHERRPVQVIDDGTSIFPKVTADEGFHAILAVPILSQRVGNVVLLVHRHQPQPFSESEVELVLTFANYATLAWEHAVLYERSDERLRAVARDNERLYREADAEKRTLAAIMGSIRDGLLLTGTDGSVLYANPGVRALLGQTETTLEGASIEDVHARLSSMVQAPEQYTRDRARAEAGEIDEWVVETAGDQQERALQLRLFDVRDDADQQIGHGMLLRDITRERELDQFKTTLLAAVGHELRTPLASIKGHASTLLQEDITWPVEEQRHFLRTISSEADGLARLVSNLLDLARSDAGLLSIRREPADLRQLVTSAVRRMEGEGASIALDLSANLPAVEIDAGRIEVVLHNLLVNARKYGGRDVRVSARAHDEVVVVRVSDDGPGISPEDAPHIFERFYRAQHPLIQRIGGTGLGLAICKAFVEAHGGAIWAEPRDTGTCIAFELPAAAALGERTAPGLMTRSGR